MAHARGSKPAYTGSIHLHTQRWAALGVNVAAVGFPRINGQPERPVNADALMRGVRGADVRGEEPRGK